MPSGTLWATENIKDKNGKDLYFAWGETSGYTTANNGKTFDISHYKFYNDAYTPSYDVYIPPYTKYANDFVFQLESIDDAATANWGPEWRMPKSGQIDELIANTDSSWEYNDDLGEYGLLLTSINNGETIFFPLTQYINGDEYEGNETGCFWSSTLGDESSADYARILFVGYSGPGNSGIYRYYGCTIRPVRSGN